MEKIIEILKVIRPDMAVTESTELFDGSGLDSLDMIRLVSDLEKSFAISIPGDQMTPENFQNILAIERFIKTAETKAK